MDVGDEIESDGSNSPRRALAKLPATAHDWEWEWQYQKQLRRSHPVYDDGTMTFFWRAHTVLTLVVFLASMVYLAIFEDPTLHDNSYNFKRGVIACALTFLLVGVTQTPDGPFCRPHPAFWRLLLCVSILYELALIFLLFQTVDYARELLKEIDPKLGVPLPERSYANNCMIYDSSNPSNPWHNVWDKFDIFVAVHFFGWWVKALMLRDYWLCHTLSILFEVMEYTLEHQVPNFAECWWDHFIMDILVCNGLGIWLGMRTLDYLSWKKYSWRGIWNLPSLREKLQRLAAQFTPYSWTDFQWKPTLSLKRWLAMLGVIAMFIIAELNNFYLKLILWLEPAHTLCIIRIVFIALVGTVSMRETFEYLDNPDCKRFGRQSWIMSAIIITEVLVAAKFEPQTVFKPIPFHVSMFWMAGIVGLFLFTIWKFYLRTHFFLHTHSKNSPKHASNGVAHETPPSNHSPQGAVTRRSARLKITHASR
ncbi:phosphatidylserine synthase 2-like [Watersipora subatra]|uniref:phosphatidylserine synthase 2-like n=1 Tax=Watersipora subatra TaxID=2589382 RepID=UPI00355BFF19